MEGEEWSEFCEVQKNKDACLNFLVGHVQSIERYWEDEQRRKKEITLLYHCLCALQNHKSADLREVARLSEKIKLSSIDSLDLKHFLGLFLPIERKYTRGLCDHQFLIDREDKEPNESQGQVPTIKSGETIPLFVVLDNIRSAFNVGSIFRTAECVGVRKIFLCGYTATPQDEKTKKTTMGAHRYVEWEWFQHIDQVLDIFSNSKENEEKSEQDIRAPLPIVALETVAEQPLLYDMNFQEMHKQGGCVLILGNERHGIEADILKRCTGGIVRIPCIGVKNSLNVAVAFGICAYEIFRQWKT